MQKSRLPEGADEKGSYRSGGFAGQDADNSPDGGTVDPPGEGDASPHGTPGALKTEEAGRDLEVGERAKDPAPGSLGNVDDPSEVGERGYGQQADYDANEPGARQQHPRTPSDMGNR